MIKRILALGGMSIGFGLMLGLAAQPASAQQAQQPPADKPTANKTATAKTYTPPKTPWGEPDLQGVWPLNHLISTPFQRQEKYGDRRLMTDEEFAAAQKSAGVPTHEPRRR